jgi:four helix bundle protein
MKENILKQKSYAFALRIMKLSDYLEEQRRYVLAKQVLKAGTSIGANAEESSAGSSKRDFLSKLSISYREALETHYWLRLLKDGKYIEERLADSLLNDCSELVRMLSAITKTTRESLNKKDQDED